MSKKLRRQDKDRNLYKVKTYHYDKLSKLERIRRKEQNESKRQQELSNMELSKIVHQVQHVKNFKSQLN
jgi:hypothetical protein